MRIEKSGYCQILQVHKILIFMFSIVYPGKYLDPISVMYVDLRTLYIISLKDLCED